MLAKRKQAKSSSAGGVNDGRASHQRNPTAVAPLTRQDVQHALTREGQERDLHHQLENRQQQKHFGFVKDKNDNVEGRPYGLLTNWHPFA
jgi:hypothetical protein